MAYNPNWDCYPKAFAAIGEEADVTRSHQRNLTLTVTVGGVEYTVTRTRDFSDSYHRRHVKSKPYVVNAGAGGSGMNSVSEGDPNARYEDTGSMKEDFSFSDLNIKFMDLRHDIIVFDETEGTVTAAASNSEALGIQTIAGFGLDMAGAFNIRNANIWAVVGLPTTFHTTGSYAEKIQAEVAKTFGSTNVSDAVLYPVGVTDGSPMAISSFSYYEFNAVWGQFDVVDTRYPFSIPGQSYTKRYFYLEDEAKAPDLYDHAKLNIGQDRTLDDALCAVFSAVWGTTGHAEGAIPAIGYDTYFPFGSWAVDVDGNQFISQLTSAGVYNYLTGGSPAAVIPQGEVYYPVAPV